MSGVGGGASASDPYKITEYPSTKWWPFGGAGATIDTDTHVGWNNPNGRTRVDPTLTAERNHIFLNISNSNGGNFVQPPFYVPTSPKVQQVNVYDGGVYRVLDPILGPSSWNRRNEYGSCWGEVGDLLITANKTDRPIFIPLGIGSSDQVRWIPGNIFHHRILVAIRHMIRLGYIPGATNVTKVFVVYSAGVTDCLLTTTQQQWQDWFGLIYDSIIAAGLTPSKTFVTIETKTTVGYVDPNRVAIRAAQIAVTNGTSIVQGFDLDTLDDTHRYDGAHFDSPTGRNLLAQGHVDAFTPYM